MSKPNRFIAEPAQLKIRKGGQGEPVSLSELLARQAGSSPDPKTPPKTSLDKP
jgi:hypothetical protein